MPLSWVPLTAVPQRTALSHAFGGLAAGLVGTAKYMLWLEDGGLTSFRMFAIIVEVLLGYLTLTGSLMAAGKLQEVLPTRPITFRNQNVFNGLLCAVAVGAGAYMVWQPGDVAAVPGRDRACRSPSACCWCCPSAAPTCRRSSRCSTPTRGCRRWRWASCSTTSC